MDTASSSLTLSEGDTDSIEYTVDEGIPPSGPPAVTFNDTSFINNARVNISNSGVQINNVIRSDAGTYLATWSNAVGSATFTLTLQVTSKQQCAHCVSDAVALAMVIIKVSAWQAMRGQ